MNPLAIQIGIALGTSRPFQMKDLFVGGQAGFLADPLVTGQPPGGAIAEITNQANASPDLTQATAASRPTLGRYPIVGIRNRLSNNMMTGAVAGTPGTGPTGWSVDGSESGLIRTIGTPGSIDNVTCLDVSLAGTASATSDFDVFFSAELPASALQTWAGSVYLALSAGALTGISQIRILGFAYDSGGVFLSTFFTSGDIKGSLTSAIQRFTVSGATPANTALVRLLVKISYTSGASLSATLRIGEPQMEIAASASAVQQVTAAYDITETGIPSVSMPYYDGGDFTTFGVQSFGTASLFADAGQAWSVGGVFRTVSATAQNLVAKRGAVDADCTLAVAVRPDSLVSVRLRGTNTVTALAVADGELHSWLLIWDGIDAYLVVDSGAPVALGVGAAAEEAQNILVGARTESSPANFFTGFNHCELMIDRALSTAEQNQFFAQCAAKYGTPT